MRTKCLTKNNNNDMGLVVAQITDRKLGGAWSNAEGVGSGDCEEVRRTMRTDDYFDCLDFYKTMSKRKAKKAEMSMLGISDSGSGGSNFNVDSILGTFNNAMDMFTNKQTPPPTDIKDEKDDDDKSNTPLIVGGVVAVAVIGAVIYFVNKK